MNFFLSAVKLIAVTMAVLVVSRQILGNVALMLAAGWGSAWRVTFVQLILGLAMVLSCYIPYRLGILPIGRELFRVPRWRELFLCYGVGVLIPLVALFCSLPFGHYVAEFEFLGFDNMASMIIAFGNAVQEEIPFRIWVLGATLLITRSLPASILLQALLFAFSHAENGGWSSGFSILYFATGGVFFAAVLIRWQSLWAAVCVHAGINGVVNLLYGGKFQFGDRILVESHGPHDQMMVGVLIALTVYVFYRKSLPIFGGSFFGASLSRDA